MARASTVIRGSFAVRSGIGRRRWASWWAGDSDPTVNSSPSPPKEDRSKASQKHHPLHRLSAVKDAMRDRKLPPELRGRSNAVRSETDIINVVEQRIWHSMEEGQFENLPGKGKPLEFASNPHADPADDTLYRILAKNGCAPEWVERNKEIQNRIAEWRLALKRAWANKSNHNGTKWSKDSEALKAEMRNINKKVLHYNLIVPFARQMFGLKWEKELDRLDE
ncbi:hypothetical protein QJS10_CPA06g00180 [Acorus calamus]|uniref:DnaJ homologue subfamily C member 28 conserved domain-containing protein n=1 Tax=Acorus calamus TaxID=4465 RepID=A0AAV9ES88_ACOCL|nr:hypothetical protein QJS10_CPA06g00180 [Acorus calamus]